MDIDEWRRHGIESVKTGITNSRKKYGVSIRERKPNRDYISTEKATQRACLDLLFSKKIFHYRNNSGAGIVNGQFMKFGMKGSPDIIAVIGGQYIAIEVKDIHGKQSESQVLFQKKLEASGGQYIVIRNVDELIRFLSEKGL